MSLARPTGNIGSELARFREAVSGWFTGEKASDVPPEVLEDDCLRLSL